MTTSYSIRVSQRARHVRFQVTPERGLEVIVPKRFDRAKVPALVLKNKRWIERAIAKVKLLNESRVAVVPWRIPTEIYFQAVDTQWQVVTTKASGGSIFAHERPGQILALHGAIDDPLACRTVLGRWLTRRGVIYLEPWLKRVSLETGLQYTSFTVKQQKTRWGSCSHRKSINLNARLLFLPSEVVHYILVHELCHTKHLNHSDRFWRLVEFYLPNYREVDRELRNTDSFMPAWLQQPHQCSNNRG